VHYVCTENVLSLTVHSITKIPPENHRSARNQLHRSFYTFSTRFHCDRPSSERTFQCNNRHLQDRLYGTRKLSQLYQNPVTKHNVGNHFYITCLVTVVWYGLNNLYVIRKRPWRYSLVYCYVLPQDGQLWMTCGRYVKGMKQRSFVQCEDCLIES